MPIEVLRHKWTTDPYTMGTYSHPKIGMTTDHLRELSTPLPNETNPRLLFAGEATNPDHWSNLQGARLSGLREAQRIIKLVNLSTNQSTV